MSPVRVIRTTSPVKFVSLPRVRAIRSPLRLVTSPFRDVKSPARLIRSVRASVLNHELDRIESRLRPHSTHLAVDDYLNSDTSRVSLLYLIKIHFSQYIKIYRERIWTMDNVIDFLLQINIF